MWILPHTIPLQVLFLLPCRFVRSVPACFIRVWLVLQASGRDTPCSLFQTSGWLWKRKHLPRCFKGRCLREPSKETSKEAKLHIRQCPFSMRLLSSVSQASPLTRPKRGSGYGCSPPTRAGNLFSPPYSGETPRKISYPRRRCKRKFCRILESSFA